MAPAKPEGSGTARPWSGRLLERALTRGSGGGNGPAARVIQTGRGAAAAVSRNGLVERARHLAGTLEMRGGPSLGIASRPLLGRLPVAPVVQPDVRSLLDYAADATCLVSGLAADSGAAKIAGVALDVSGASLSLMAL